MCMLSVLCVNQVSFICTCFPLSLSLCFDIMKFLFGSFTIDWMVYFHLNGLPFKPKSISPSKKPQMKRTTNNGIKTKWIDFIDTTPYRECVGGCFLFLRLLLLRLLSLPRLLLHHHQQQQVPSWASFQSSPKKNNEWHKMPSALKLATKGIGEKSDNAQVARKSFTWRHLFGQTHRIAP